jgi:hypothetical protein
VAAIDIFGSGYVLRDDEGWEITAAGRDFLQSLEAVTQDNLPQAAGDAQPDDIWMPAPRRGDLIVVGHRFKNRARSAVSRHAAFAATKVVPRGGSSK